jgi:CO/xanthine dehydrogenase Mo-binding subunit
VGRPLPRFEDLRFVRGAGRYTDDIAIEGQAFAVVLRSPHAHARITRVDTAAARACARRTRTRESCGSTRPRRARSPACWRC